MPIIQVERKEIRTQIKAAIETEVQEKLRAYCRFSGATNDQVISGALKFLFKSDTDFTPWYEAHKNDSQPRRGPRKRIMAEPSHGAATPITEKVVLSAAAKR